VRRGSVRPGATCWIFGFAFVDVGEGGVGGAEIDADFHGIVENCVGLCMGGGSGASKAFLNRRNQFRVKLL
jgi:hypothetical protein